MCLSEKMTNYVCIRGATDGGLKSYPHRSSKPLLSSSLQVAIPATLSRPSCFANCIIIRFIHPIINPLNAKLNPICHFLALFGAHPILHVSRIRVNISRKSEYLYLKHAVQNVMSIVHNVLGRT